MKLSDDLQAKFNDQITLELSASIVYRQLAIAMDVQDLPGMALWLRHQADEELVHLNKFLDHCIDRGNHPLIGAVEAPPSVELSPLQVFEAALAHEEKVSEAIRNLYRACEAAGDLDSRPLLNWFLEEQVEEESTVSTIVGKIRLIGDDGPGLLRLDADLGRRPASTTENLAE
jgi:ferritin